MEPEKPVIFNVPELDRAQTVSLVERKPATEAEATTIFIVSEYLAEQAPLVTKALYQRVVTKLVKVCEVVVLEMLVQEVPLLVENSQRVTEPV